MIRLASRRSTAGAPPPAQYRARAPAAGHYPAGRRRIRYAPRSLDAPLHTDEGDGSTGADLLAGDDRALARSEDAAALCQLGQVLDDRSWEIVRLRFAEDLKQREIGERVGCSQMHVSRILRDAVIQLREAAHEANVVFD